MKFQAIYFSSLVYFISLLGGLEEIVETMSIHKSITCASLLKKRENVRDTHRDIHKRKLLFIDDTSLNELLAQIEYKKYDSDVQQQFEMAMDYNNISCRNLHLVFDTLFLHKKLLEYYQHHINDLAQFKSSITAEEREFFQDIYDWYYLDNMKKTLKDHSKLVNYLLKIKDL